VRTPAASGNTLVEGGCDRRHHDAGLDPQQRKGRLFALESLTGKSQDAPRLPSGMGRARPRHRRRFCGAGSVLLVGGDPASAKSTLLTQATSLLARAGHPAPSTFPAKRPSPRCGCAPSGSVCGCAGSVGRGNLRSRYRLGRCPKGSAAPDRHRLIQTMWTDTVESAPGHGDPGARFGAGADSFLPRIRRGDHPGSAM